MHTYVPVRDNCMFDTTKTLQMFKNVAVYLSIFLVSIVEKLHADKHDMLLKTTSRLSAKQLNHHLLMT